MDKIKRLKELVKIYDLSNEYDCVPDEDLEKASKMFDFNMELAKELCGMSPSNVLDEIFSVIKEL